MAASWMKERERLHIRVSARCVYTVDSPGEDPSPGLKTDQTSCFVSSSEIRDEVWMFDMLLFVLLTAWTGAAPDVDQTLLRLLPRCMACLRLSMQRTDVAWGVLQAQP